MSKQCFCLNQCFGTSSLSLINQIQAKHLLLIDSKCQFSRFIFTARCHNLASSVQPTTLCVRPAIQIMIRKIL